MDTESSFDKLKPFFPIHKHASDNGPIVGVFISLTRWNVGRKLLLNCNHSITRVVATLGSHLTLQVH